MTGAHAIGESYTALIRIGGVIVGIGASWFQQRTKLEADEKRLDKQLRAERKLWIPDDDPVREAFRAVLDAFNDAFHLLDDGEYDEIADGDNDLAVKIEHFQVKARERVGLRSLVQVTS